MSRILDRVNGVARCPYDPRHNSTAVVTENGELYAATVIDFSGRDPVIYRSLGKMPPLRTAQYNSKWLNGMVWIHFVVYVQSFFCPIGGVFCTLFKVTQNYLLQ